MGFMRYALLFSFVSFPVVLKQDARQADHFVDPFGLLE
jgi:hypothetical protein